MSRCDELVEHLEDAVSGTLDGELLAHCAECEACRAAVEAARGPRADGALAAITAPPELVARLKRLPRLSLQCEQAQERIAAALDEGGLDEGERSALVGHLHDCPHCRAAWEAFATLREIGGAVQAPGTLRAGLALHPKNRITTRRRRRVFDLRLATAAAYLLAALSVAAAGDPASLARAGTEGMERATFFARAAVENRLESYADGVKRKALSVIGWAGGVIDDASALARRMFGSDDENPDATADVVGSENGGS